MIEEKGIFEEDTKDVFVREMEYGFEVVMALLVKFKVDIDLVERDRG